MWTSSEKGFEDMIQFLVDNSFTEKTTPPTMNYGKEQMILNHSKLSRYDEEDDNHIYIDVMQIPSDMTPEDYVNVFFDFDGLMLVLDSNGNITSPLEISLIDKIKEDKEFTIVNIKVKSKERCRKYIKKGFTIKTLE